MPVACPRLAPAIQNGDPFDERIVEMVREYTAPLRDARVDTVILGCTHYPLVERLLRRNLPNTRLIKSGEELARELRESLERKGLLRDDAREGRYRFACSGDPAAFQALGTRFLQMPLGDVERVDITRADILRAWRRHRSRQGRQCTSAIWTPALPCSRTAQCGVVRRLTLGEDRQRAAVAKDDVGQGADRRDEQARPDRRASRRPRPRRRRRGADRLGRQLLAEEDDAALDLESALRAARHAVRRVVGSGEHLVARDARAAAQALAEVERAVDLDRVCAAGAPMQAVDVLGDQLLDDPAPLQFGHRAMRRVRLDAVDRGEARAMEAPEALRSC